MALWKGLKLGDSHRVEAWIVFLDAECEMMKQIREVWFRSPLFSKNYVCSCRIQKKWAEGWYSLSRDYCRQRVEVHPRNEKRQGVFVYLWYLVLCVWYGIRKESLSPVEKQPRVDVLFVLGRGDLLNCRYNTIEGRSMKISVFVWGKHMEMKCVRRTRTAKANKFVQWTSFVCATVLVT